MDCDLIVGFEGTSRTHAVVTGGNGQFTLSDKSRNGTYLATEDRPPVVIKQETVVLRGRGQMFLGPDPTVPGGVDEIIGYECLGV